MSKHKEYQCMICGKNKVYCTVASNGDGDGESGFGPNRPVCKDLECREKAWEMFTKPELEARIKQMEEEQARLEEQKAEIERREAEKLRQKIKEEEKKSQESKDERKEEYTSPSYSFYCSNCSQKNSGNYYYNKKQNDHHKFCSKNCAYEYYQKWTCQECSKFIIGRYFINKTDNNKFCSKKCIDYFYAPTCDICQQKSLGDTTYYNNVKKQTGIICLTCYQKRQAEIRNKQEQEHLNNQFLKDQERERERERAIPINLTLLNILPN